MAGVAKAMLESHTWPAKTCEWHCNFLWLFFWVFWHSDLLPEFDVCSKLLTADGKSWSPPFYFLVCVSLFFLCVYVFRHLRLHWVTRMPCSCRLRPSSCTWGWTEHTEQAQCDRHSERKPETVRQKLQQCDRIWSKADAMLRQNYNNGFIQGIDFYMSVILMPSIWKNIR